MPGDDPTTPTQDFDPLLKTAEAELRARYGGTPRLEVVDILRERYRNRVLRCRVADAGGDAPETVILKTSVGDGETAFDPARDDLHGAAWRFYNEWAGNAFLDAVGFDPPLSAGLLGANRDAGLILLRDLGATGASLADRLQGTDPDALTDALLSYAGSIGRLQAGTVGREGEFRALRRSLGGAAETTEPEGTRWYREYTGPFRALCAAVEVAVPDALDAELAHTRDALDAPGPFVAFAPGDTCPDNHRLTDTGYVRFFDFEFAGFGPALLTGAYLFLPFPTCWCVNRLPDDLVGRMESAYRQELAAGCPAASDDATFFPALLAACAFWTVGTVGDRWEDSLREDSPWGISSVRQRHLLRLDNFAALAERHALYPALGDLSARLADALRTHWQLEAEMPLYPPFRAA